VIGSFRCKHTETFYCGTKGKFPPSDIRAVARRKLAQLDAAVLFEDLRQPPGNNLEQLKGERAGQWSIRINKQWRICFTWITGSIRQADGTTIEVGQPHDVEIVDYH
jgi:proteic killer suppression protein